MAPRFVRPLIKSVAFLALSLGLAVLLFHVIWKPFQVFGSSMSPTLTPGDYLLVDRVWFRAGEVDRGDLVVFPRPGGEAFVVKRVVGVGGDTVEWRRGGVSVNGHLWLFPAESAEAPDWSYGTWVVPPGTLFCLGDNLACSEDSRSFGPVERDRLYGRVVLRYLPPSRWAWLDGKWSPPAGGGGSP